MPEKMMALILSGLMLVTTACSWHLRGSQVDSNSDTAASGVAALALGATDIYTPLFHAFKLDYEKHRVDLVNTENQPQLKLLSETSSVRILSLNTELDPAENEIAYTIQYQITLPGQLPKIYTKQLFRTYTQNKNRAIASDNEKNKLIDEMRHEAAERILNQIGALLRQQPKSIP